MKFVFFYRSIPGVSVPDYWEGTEDELKARFKDSTTPIIGIIPINSDDVRKAVTIALQAQLDNTPKQAIGYYHSLVNTIAFLNPETPTK